MVFLKFSGQNLRCAAARTLAVSARAVQQQPDQRVTKPSQHATAFPARPRAGRVRQLGEGYVWARMRGAGREALLTGRAGPVRAGSTRRRRRLWLPPQVNQYDLGIVCHDCQANVKLSDICEW
jgi:hypothetical protein